MSIHLLSQNEGKTIEFKENTQSTLGIIKTIIAFANTAGGSLIIGVEDKTKKILGVKNILQEEERLANIIADSIEPALFPDIEIFSHVNAELLLIHVPYIPGPFYYKKSNLQQGTYVRLGSTNRVADGETLAALLRAAKQISFDETLCKKASFDDLDEALIKKSLKSMYENLQENNYESLGLIRKDRKNRYPTYAALLLFSQDRIPFLPDSMIQMVCFAGNNRAIIIDQKEIISPLIKASREIITFIDRHTNVGAYIDEIERLDVPQFPAVAVREAVMNAIVHADYSLVGSSIQIAVFADRIEITNPGTLPFGQSLESALSGISKMRNKIIGRIFRELKFIERLGSGILRILAVYQNTNALPPKFEEIDNNFRVTLFAIKLENTPKESWEKILITELSKREKLGSKEIAQLWGVTVRTARDRLKMMLLKRLLKRIANSKTDPTAQYTLY